MKCAIARAAEIHYNSHEDFFGEHAAVACMEKQTPINKQRVSTEPPESDVHSILQYLLGPAFSRDLRGAVRLRRLTPFLLHPDDIDDLRATALEQYLEKIHGRRKYQKSAENRYTTKNLGRSLANAAVYQLICREYRRVARLPKCHTGELDEIASQPSEAPDLELYHEPPAKTTNTKTVKTKKTLSKAERLHSLDIPRDSIHAARVFVVKSISKVAQSNLTKRSGSSVFVELARSETAGAAKWVREFEGDREAESLAKDVAADGGIAVPPRDVVLLLRWSARGDDPPPDSLARLARTAITNPGDYNSGTRR